MPFLLQVILILAVLGFCFYLLQKVNIASPFREIIYFVAVIGLILWLLEGFGVMHTGMFRWHR